MHSVAEAVQWMRRNCTWMISKLKGHGHFNSPPVERLTTTGHLNGRVSPQQNLFSKGEWKREAQVLGGWHGGPFPFTHLAITEYFLHEHRVSTSEGCQILPAHTYQAKFISPGARPACCLSPPKDNSLFLLPTQFLSFFPPDALRSAMKFCFAPFQDMPPWVKSLQGEKGHLQISPSTEVLTAQKSDLHKPFWTNHRQRCAKSSKEEEKH